MGSSRTNRGEWWGHAGTLPVSIQESVGFQVVGIVGLNSDSIMSSTERLFDHKRPDIEF